MISDYYNNKCKEHFREDLKLNKEVEKLITDNYDFVCKLVSRYYGWLPNETKQDLIGYGMVGLVKSAKSYTADKGVKFSTFAYHSVMGHIKMGIRDDSFESGIGSRSQRVNRESKRVCSLEEQIEYTGVDSFTDNADDFSKLVEYIDLYKAIECLNEREKQILELRYWGELKQQEIADLYGITQAAIYVSLKRSIKKLRNILQVEKVS